MGIYTKEKLQKSLERQEAYQHNIMFPYKETTRDNNTAVTPKKRAVY